MLAMGAVHTGNTQGVYIACTRASYCLAIEGYHSISVCRKDDYRHLRSNKRPISIKLRFQYALAYQCDDKCSNYAALYTLIYLLARFTTCT
jgi:hypothetical protein